MRRTVIRPSLPQSSGTVVVVLSLVSVVLDSDVPLVVLPRAEEVVEPPEVLPLPEEVVERAEAVVLDPVWSSPAKTVVSRLWETIV
jgi:hypothetical protein